jgi:hypothetical protein
MVLILGSCSNFLNEENKSGITNEEFYATEVGFTTLVTASYNSLRTVYGGTPWLLCAGTDMYQRERGTGNKSIQEYEQLYATDSYVKTFYQNVYSAIQITNMALKYSDLAVVTDAKRATWKAELTFLRAYYHFALVEQFGGICISKEATMAPRMNMPRSSLADSYAFIIGEMEAALPNLGVEVAKINKTVANHYLAKVYLTRGWDLKQNADFDKAKTYATAAIAGKGITIPYETLWSPTNENNDEIIFSIQYDAKSLASTTSGNNQQSLFGPYLGGSELKHKYMSTVLYPSWNLHNFYTENDARYDATYMLTIYDQYFYYYDATKDKSKMLVRAYYPRVWGREYTDADLNAWKAAHPAQIASNIKYYPFKSDEVAYRAAYESDFCTPVIKKFDSPATSAIFDQNCSTRDIVLARRAETYFLYAEACIGLNEFVNADANVQKVLDRPGNAKNGLKLLPNTSIAAAANQSAALNAFLIESAKEFAGEYLRWPELRRTGKLKELCGKYNYDIKKVGVDIAFKGLDGLDKIYRPIPQDAIDLNEAKIEQNPGYVAK